MDLVTLYFTSTITAVSAAVAMFYVWRVHRHERAVGYWMLGFVATALGTLPFALGGILPAAFTRIFGNSAAMIALALLYAGTAIFLEKRVLWRALVVVYVPALLLNLYATLIVDSLALRVTAYTICAVSACSLMAYGLIVQIPEAQRAVGRFVGGTWLIYVAGCVMRVVGVWQAGPGATLVDIGTPQNLFFGVLQMVTLLSSIGHLLLASQRLQLRLDDLANRDDLTGVLNRRAFRTQASERRTSVTKGKPFVLMVLDIDHFKRVNDRLGHAAGDLVLRQVSALVESRLRKGDIFARAGGEEFWLLSSEIPAADAATVAERLRAEVEQLSVDVDGEAVRVTISIGVAVFASEEAGSDLREALERADKALYEAKESGRNRVIVEQQRTPRPIASDLRISVAVASVSSHI